jgi:hypothetical protein
MTTTTTTKPQPMTLDERREAARTAGLWVPQPTRGGHVPDWLTTRLRITEQAIERERLIAEAGAWYHARHRACGASTP